MVKAPEQKKTKLNNRDAEKFWPETYTADRVDKKSFAEFLGEVETYLSVLASGLLARPLLEWAAAFRNQPIVLSDVEAYEAANGKGKSRKTDGRKFRIGNVYTIRERKRLFLSLYVDDVEMAGKKQNLDPMWKILMKEVDLGVPTSFLDHVYLGCAQRECKTSKDAVDNYRNMFEARISARTKKLLCSGKPDADISSWSYDMEGHAKKCVERYCELANKTTQQLQSHNSIASMTINAKNKNWDLLENCQSMLSNCHQVLVFCTHWWTRHSMVSKKTCTSSHRMDQSL